mmetsp:Transcript_14122/g.41451  ORF Transcript_14122/g.41451 Transcript_14122/m.41451 type:complete len:255 (+) Transcript_14122:1459-2223(+)
MCWARARERRPTSSCVSRTQRTPASSKSRSRSAPTQAPTLHTAAACCLLGLGSPRARHAPRRRPDRIAQGATLAPASHARRCMTRCNAWPRSRTLRSATATRRTKRHPSKPARITGLFVKAATATTAAAAAVAMIQRPHPHHRPRHHQRPHRRPRHRPRRHPAAQTTSTQSGWCSTSRQMILPVTQASWVDFQAFPLPLAPAAFHGARQNRQAAARAAAPASAPMRMRTPSSRAGPCSGCVRLVNSTTAQVPRP